MQAYERDLDRNEANYAALTPIAFIALTSPSMVVSDLQDYAEHLIVPTLSTIDGVAQVNIFGPKRYAVRVRVMPEALAAFREKRAPNFTSR